ncbi:MAG: hypothetical protein CM1200mP33_1730 [Chloroflexota bacterium]|nr:MAG: hypothetical protein CM1200mP33_1730 [Chloroflexota bacterium]
MEKETTIVGIIFENKFVDKITLNGNGKDKIDLELLTDSTTFYPEGGGQVGDVGNIYNLFLISKYMIHKKSSQE